MERAMLDFFRNLLKFKKLWAGYMNPTAAEVRNPWSGEQTEIFFNKWSPFEKLGKVWVGPYQRNNDLLEIMESA